jgi:hypothetical protein
VSSKVNERQQERRKCEAHQTERSGVCNTALRRLVETWLQISCEGRETCTLPGVCVSERVSTVVPSATGCASNGRLAVGVAVGVAGGWVGVELIAAWVTNEAIVRRLSKSFWGFGCHGKDVLKMFEKIGIERRSKSGAWGNISLEMTFASKIELFDIERHLL